MSDSEKIKGKKEQAMQLFLTYYNYVQNVAIRNAPAKHLQGDIVNDAFIDFVAKADQWEYKDDLRPLLRAITENLAKKYWRNYLKGLPESMRKLAEHLQNFAEEENREMPESDKNEELQALELCMNKLTPRNRELIDAYYFADRTLVDIAKENDLNYGTLCKLILRVRAALRRCIENVLKAANHE
ncbi:MAG: sigma-70 family RNA polymerase sigma factor [Planctomycetia bacterium]|nr:sigma-70 family RNA polymerase sigma factor [Planctomycetia bacterium]